MPIPLDIANLATGPIEDDVAGRLDLANLNSSSSQNDTQQQEPSNPLPNALEVIILPFQNLLTDLLFHRPTKSTITKT